MSTGFFKDITGGNNKFVPRSFQFNLGHNDSASKDSPDSSVISKNLSVPLKDSSTAPSTGASSKFFQSNSSADSSEVFNGAKPDSTYLLDELSLESVNEEESINETNSLKLPNKAEQVDEDDLEITEIREASPDSNSSKIQEVGTYIDTNQPIEQTSSDVLLEALYKSQRVCTSLKRNLEVANVKISHQEDQITNNKKSLEMMKTNFKNFKTNLYLIEKNSRDLVDSRAADNNKIKEMKAEYLAVSETIKVYKEEVSGLKKKIENLKQLKNATSYEIERRNKDISTLQKKLDETSGFLSEQKIRTLQLEKILEEARKHYDAKIDKATEHAIKFQNELMKKLNDTDSSIVTQVKFSKTLQLTDNSLSEEIKEASRIHQEGLKLSQKANKGLESSFKAVMETQKNTDAALKSITDLCKELSNSTTSEHSIVNESFLNLEEKLTQLKEDIKKGADDSKRIDALNERIGLLNKEAINSNDIIKDMELLITERSNEIKDLKSKTEYLTSKETTLTDKILALEASLLAKDKYLKDSEDKFQKSKGSIESKLKTQMEIYKMVVQERDEIKAEQEAKEFDLKKTLQLQDEGIKKLETEKKELFKVIEEERKVNHDLKSELIILKEQNVSLNERLKQQAKELASRSVTPPLRGAEVQNDHLVLRVPPASKPVSKSKTTFNTWAKPKAAPPPQAKRKKLLDEDEDSSFVFDKFDLGTIDEELPSLQKKYTKRKKTKT